MTTPADYIANTLTPINTAGATLTWEVIGESSETVSVGHITRIDPPVGDLVPPDADLTIYESTGAGGGVAFAGIPPFAMFNGYYQGAG